MASIFKLTDEHIKMIESFLPKVRGVERVHLKETLNGILHVPADRMPLGGHAVAVRQPQDCLQHVQALFPERGLGAGFMPSWSAGKVEITGAAAAERPRGAPPGPLRGGAGAPVGGDSGWRRPGRICIHDVTPPLHCPSHL